MILPDVNVLIYAFRDEAKDHHRYRRWLLSVRDGDAAYGISPQVLASLVRIVTNRRVFVRPNELPQVLAFCSALMAPEHCQIVRPGVRHWPIFADLSLQVKASGNLVQDAWFAALAIEHGCEWITDDRDYARFPALRWRTPF